MSCFSIGEGRDHEACAPDTKYLSDMWHVCLCPIDQNHSCYTPECRAGVVGSRQVWPVSVFCVTQLATQLEMSQRLCKAGFEEEGGLVINM